MCKWALWISLLALFHSFLLVIQIYLSIQKILIDILEWDPQVFEAENMLTDNINRSRKMTWGVFKSGPVRIKQNFNCSSKWHAAKRDFNIIFCSFSSIGILLNIPSGVFNKKWENSSELRLLKGLKWRHQDYN